VRTLHDAIEEVLQGPARTDSSVVDRAKASIAGRALRAPARALDQSDDARRERHLPDPYLEMVGSSARDDYARDSRRAHIEVAQIELFRLR